MKADEDRSKTIDDYIAGYPPEVRGILETIRRTIRKAAPEAEKKISYQIPTFTLKGNLVHFGAWKKHVGFYPTASGIAHFQEELSIYATSRGSDQFPLDQPMPLSLITRSSSSGSRKTWKERQARQRSVSRLADFSQALGLFLRIRRFDRLIPEGPAVRSLSRVSPSRRLLFEELWSPFPRPTGRSGGEIVCRNGICPRHSQFAPLERVLPSAG